MEQVRHAPTRQGWKREKMQKTKKDLSIANVHRDTSLMEKSRCNEVEEWTPNFDWVARLLACNSIFFIILFSGHGRSGDLASWFHSNTDIRAGFCPAGLADRKVDPYYAGIGNVFGKVKTKYILQVKEKVN